MNADDLAQLITTQFNWDNAPEAEAIATWVGHAFLHATDRDPNDPDVFYNVKDYRRAVAYLRVVGVMGYGTGKVAARLHARVREMAAWHATGAIIVTKLDTVPDAFTDWYANEHVDSMLVDAVVGGASVLVIPCEVAGIGSVV